MDGFSAFILFFGLSAFLALLVRSIINEGIYVFVLSLLGCIFIGIVFITAPINGEPSKEIRDGSHQISFIHERGTDLVLGLESQKDQTGGRLIVYIFSKDAFSGEIKKEAKQLNNLKFPRLATSENLF